MLAKKLHKIEMMGRLLLAGNCWSAMRRSLLAAAQEVVGYGGSDWFQGSSGILTSLTDVKNVCRQRMLQNDIPPLR